MHQPKIQGAKRFLEILLARRISIRYACKMGYQIKEKTAPGGNRERF